VEAIVSQRNSGYFFVAAQGPASSPGSPRLIELNASELAAPKLVGQGAHAPATRHYEELNIFGSSTGDVACVRGGERLPGLRQRFTCRAAGGG
jgi:hypothetical protein